MIALSPATPASRRRSRDWRHRRRRGWSLATLVVALVAFGAVVWLASDAFPELSGHGSVASCRRSQEAAETASLAFFAATGSWPRSFDDLIGGDATYLDLGQEVDQISPNELSSRSWTLTIAAAGGGQPTYECVTS